MVRADVTARLERLRRKLGAGTDPDERLRGDCEAELAELRRLFRKFPDAFDASVVDELRAIAGRLARAPEQGVPYPAPSRARPREAAEATSSSAPRVREALKATFGYDSFRPGQEAIIEAVLSGRDCVGVMPTGAGKSLTYQLPARLLGGTTLVISPLIALMKDQVDALGEAGVRATFLNSTLDPDERRKRVEGLRAGAYEIVYAAPEGLEASVGSALRDVRLSLIAVDEAHCISQWGHDFRPAYRNLSRLRARFGNVPLLALTATATHEVVRDIIAQLAMKQPAQYRGSFFRPNLHIHVHRKGDAGTPKIREAVLKLVRARPGQTGIVYCLARKSVESTAEYLRDNGIDARAYHAGMEPAVRTEVQDAFRRDKVDVIVATIAFGMGIDKSNIRFVIHRDMPRSIEAYYQEIGRAGRDGLESDCVLFYSFADVLSYDRFADDSAEEIAEHHREKVRQMFDWADRRVCRHQTLVRYLGETVAPCRTSCDVCLRRDIVAEAASRPQPRRASRKKDEPLAPAGALVDPADPGLPQDEDLFQKLRALRKRLADARGLPAYVIFSDATLMQMAAARPLDEAGLLAISGVGPRKVSQYGEEFLRVLREG